MGVVNRNLGERDPQKREDGGEGQENEEGLEQIGRSLSLGGRYTVINSQRQGQSSSGKGKIHIT